jgi:predicted nuclease of predicted toxin-antitoxin system
LDSDFHSLLPADHARTPSAIRIRIEGLKGNDVADLIEQVVTATETELEAGAAVSVTNVASLRVARSLASRTADTHRLTQLALLPVPWEPSGRAYPSSACV